MQRLEHAAELLDGPLGTHDTVVANLRDLERANRWFGGAVLSRRALLRLTSGTYAGPARRRFDWRRGPLRMLDVGTGGADIPVALLDWAERRSLPLEIHAVDSREEVVAAAEDLAPDVDGLELDVADAARLPFPDASFDVVHCSLLLHHFDPDDAVAALREMRRVCRLGVIVNDLDRNRRALVGAWVFGHTVAVRRYSRHDAPMSVRRAYRPPEVAQLAARAGLVEALRVTGFAGHRYAIAFVPADGSRSATGDASADATPNEDDGMDTGSDGAT
jgi:ubiquinone/menaquinone biosynthesis C-methylase UbiE